MAQKPRRGRPKIGSGQTKSKSLLLRMSPAEKRAFEDAAQVAGAPLSVWIRERLRRAAIKDLEDVGRIPEFLKELDANV